MLTLGNADAPAGKISREGNHRHVTHMGKKDQNKEGKVPLSYPLSLVVHALALAVFHLWVTFSLPVISKCHFSRPQSHIALSHAHSYWSTAFM